MEKGRTISCATHVTCNTLYLNGNAMYHRDSYSTVKLTMTLYFCVLKKMKHLHITNIVVIIFFIIQNSIYSLHRIPVSSKEC